MNIPVVNLDQYINGSEMEKKMFVHDLGQAFVDIGFVAVTNPGISDQLISDLYTITQQFFSLPVHVKSKYEIDGLYGQRGYTSFGKEHAKGSDAPDLKEFFQYGQITPGLESFPANVKVSELPSFNHSFELAFASFEKSGGYLLEAIAQFLGLDVNYFQQQIISGNSILRAIHYPPILQEPSSAIRAEQHEDINLITLLVGASADGLEILSKDNQWLPVLSQPNQIVVNVGDMLQRLTNNYLKSTTHRVVNPPKNLWHTSRYSIPFFLHPVSQMSLACLASCIDETHPKSYDDITAGAYLDQRLQEIGLKK